MFGDLSKAVFGRRPRATPDSRPAVALNSRFIGDVALERPVDLTPERLVQEIRNRFTSRDLNPSVIARSEGSGPAKWFLIEADRVLVQVSFFNEPIPRELFVDDIHQNAWPGWKAAADRQKAHVIVSNKFEATNHAAAVQTAAAVLAVSAALARISSALAVFWVNSRFLIPADMFADEVEKFQLPNLPMACLVKPSWHSLPGNPKTPAAVTVGLKPFVGREIYHPPTGEITGEIYNRILSLSSYLQKEGPAINDEDTVGATHTQKITVRLAEHQGEPVYRLEFGAQ